jgi:hypothetical protein
MVPTADGCEGRHRVGRVDLTYGCRFELIVSQKVKESVQAFALSPNPHLDLARIFPPDGD